MLTVDFTPGLYEQVFATQWGGVPVQIAAHWNERGNLWTFDLAREDTGEVLLQGCPLVVNTNVLAPFGFSLGRLVLINTIDGISNPTLDNLGTDVVAIWGAESEF